MIKKIITDEPTDKQIARWDETRFSLTQAQITQLKTIVQSPREAQEYADFVNEHNTAYQMEQGQMEKGKGKK